MGIVGDAISGVINSISSIMDKSVQVRTAITGKDPEAEAKLAEMQLDLEKLKAQAKEASDAAQADYWKATLGVTGTNFFKFFVAGPKPALFWVCVLAFGLQYVLQPVINWILGATGAVYHLAAIDMTLPTQLLIGGMGLTSVVVRGIEKINSAQGNH